MEYNEINNLCGRSKYYTLASQDSDPTLVDNLFVMRNDIYARILYSNNL